MKSIELHGSHVVEFSPFDINLFSLIWSWWLPWEDAMGCICGSGSFCYAALQPTVREGVALVEVKMALVVEEAPASLW